MRTFVIGIMLLHSLAVCRAQQSNPLVVDVSKKIAPVQPTMWGIFFEDINFAADGGLYAELVKNRSFEFSDPWMGWDIVMKNNKLGQALIINRGEDFKANPRVARISVSTDTAAVQLINEGFRGMGLKAGARYVFSVAAFLVSGEKQEVVVTLGDSNSTVAQSSFTIEGRSWKKYTVSLTSSQTLAKANLRISFNKKGETDIDMVSLFPVDTWKNRPEGLRKDLVQLLADMKPGFIRFPGGCIVEGRDLANRYQWKKTVGPIHQRELIINRWNTEFRHRSAPDYFQSYGLGFYEYFLLAEDIGAEPLPILNCGMACQFNTAEVVPTDQLDPYIQDALDLIEFANGGVDTKWGSLRASMGHPVPFNLKFIGVGNEQWGPQYAERYEVFSKAIRAKYPSVKLVGSVGPFAGGDLFNYLNPVMRAMKADLLDEHFYMPPEFFQRNARRYDNYDRNGPKIFAGEYAAHVRNTEGLDRNTWMAALSEAAFMTGLERNADVVHMTSYAPLFAHVDAWQWAPDLIWFDNLSCYGTPNYYVQKLFAVNRGSHVVPALVEGRSVAGEDSLYISAVFDEKSNELVIKVVNIAGSNKKKQLKLQGVKKTGTAASISILQHKDLSAKNSLLSPEFVKPVEKQIMLKSRKSIELELPAYSFQVLRLRTE